MSIFAEALFLLRAIESHLLGERESSIPLVANSKRLLWYPLKFLRLGMSEKTKSASLWSFLSFAFLMLGSWIVAKSGIAKTEAASFVMLACMIVPMLLVIFAVPSMYGASGISQSAIEFVADHLRSRGFEDLKDIELLKKSIKPFEERARSRVTVLKWLVGLFWAAFMYTFSKGIETPSATAAHFTSYAFSTALFLLAVVAAYVIVWGYEASLDKLFRLVEFGCNDHCHAIQQRAATAG